jgi:hypothetical protein
LGERHLQYRDLILQHDSIYIEAQRILGCHWHLGVSRHWAIAATVFTNCLKKENVTSGNAHPLTVDTSPAQGIPFGVLEVSCAPEVDYPYVPHILVSLLPF